MKEQNLEVDLGQLKGQLIAMAGYVEEAVDLAIRAWRDRDSVCISRVFQVEDQVDQEQKEVDANCLKLLAVRQQNPADLRLILSIAKINTDLERMVDQAVNIAQSAVYYLKYPALPALSDLSEMADETRFMVREAIDAFVKSDTVLANNVLQCDDKVDHFNLKIFRDVLSHIKLHPADIEPGLNVILIARNLERIADHSTNIAEDVIFTVLGTDVRHLEISKNHKPQETSL